MFDPATSRGALIWAIVFGVGALTASWLLGRAVRRVDHTLVDRPAQQARLRFGLRLARLATVLVFAVLWAHLVPQLRALGTALLASAGVVSVVLGLAAQATLGNLIAGLTILSYEPVRIGDRIQVSGPGGPETGTVESIDLSHTVLATWDNRRITIPNSQLMSETVVNLTSTDVTAMANVDVPIGYDADIDAARAVLVRVAEAHRQVDEVAAVPVTMLGPSAVVLSVRVWCADAATAAQVRTDLNEASLVALREAGIEPGFRSHLVVHRADSGTA